MRRYLTIKHSNNKLCNKLYNKISNKNKLFNKLPERVTILQRKKGQKTKLANDKM